jgi:hypothetical protein
VPEAQTIPAELLAAIYEAPANTPSWPATIERATAWVGGIAGSFQARKLAPTLEARLISTGVDPALHGAYLAHYYKNDPHLSHVTSLPVGSALLSSDVLDDRDLMGTEFYNEFCMPQGFHDLQGVVLVRNERWAVTLAMFGHTKRRFDHTTQRRLAALTPHITRALSLGFSFNGMAEAEPTLHAVAATRAVGLLYVDAQRAIVEQHETADPGEWLRGGEHGLTITNQTLVARGPHEQEKLEHAVKLALEGTASFLSFGKGPSALSTAFAPGPRRFPFGMERCVSVVFMRTEGHIEPNPFEELPTSLRSVADALARGLGDKEIAQELGLPVPTVRTYVTRCFTRLGVHNRRELIVLRANTKAKTPR